MSVLTPSRRWFGTLTGTALTIEVTDGVIGLSIEVTQGTITIQGNYSYPNNAAGTGAIPSTPVTLAAGDTYEDKTSGSQSGIDGFTIDASGGTCIVAFQF